MRMAGPDVVLFIVGALLFGGALTAIIVTQGPGAFSGSAGSPIGVYTVSWPTSTQETKTNVADFSSGSTTATVNGTNVDKVTIRVDCAETVPSAAAAAPFAISVNVDGPGGLHGKGAGNCGDKIEVPVKVQDVPAGTTAQGSTPDAAAASLPPQANATMGVGKWTITFSGARSTPATALPGTVPGAPGGDVAVVVETFAPKLDPVVK
jgi:hypothetical protein